MAEMIDGARNFDKCRMRWTQRVFEIDFSRFIEGQHVVNHLRNADVLTDKIALHGELRKISRAKDFTQESYLLEDTA